MNASETPRWRRWVIIAAIGLMSLCLFVFAGLWLSLHFLGPAKVKPLIERSASNFLGGKLTIEELDRPRFPRLELRARGIRFEDSDGRLIVYSPTVVARASIVSALKLRLGVDELRFEKPDIHLWFERDGFLNVEHIVRHIRSRPRHVAKRSVGTLLFHRFTVAEGRLRLAVRDDAPPAIDGRVNGQVTLTLSPLGLRGAPFDVTLDEGDNRARVLINGALGAKPKIQLRGEHVPARALSPRIRLIGGCAGAADMRMDWEGGNRPTFDFSVSPSGLCRDAGDLPERVSGTARREKSTWTLDLIVIGSQTHVTVRGAVPPAPGVLAFQANGERADVPALLSWAKAASAMSKQTQSRQSHSPVGVRALDIKVNLASATWKNVQAQSIAFTLSRSTSGTVAVGPAIMNIFGGRAEGRAEVREGTVFLQARGHDWSLAEINSAVSSTAALTGRLSLAIDGQSPVGAPVLSSFAGKSEVWVENFELERVPAILKTLTSANFARLEQSLKGGKRTPFPPATGNAQANVNGGVADIQKLTLENRFLKIAYTGQVNVVTRDLKGTLVLQALTAADQIINDIPVLRDLLLGKGKSFLPLWFHIQGPWTDPRVRPLPAKSIATPVWDIFKRVLELPQEVIDKVRGKN